MVTLTSRSKLRESRRETGLTRGSKLCEGRLECGELRGGRGLILAYGKLRERESFAS